MKCLVTGGAGFLGSHLCDLLIEKGNQVVCMDHLGSGSLKNIAHLRSNENFEFINHNVIKPITLADKIDQIYHLASRASPIDYQEFPVETALTNSVGTWNLLEYAKTHNIPLLFSSTSETYGDPDVTPQPETYWGNVNPIGMRSCYDESKRFGEALMMAYQREYGVDIKIVRIFNTYGPRLRRDDGRVVTNFIAQALEGQPITIYGDGKQTRSFCYVTDLIDGIYKMMNSKEMGPINLGNPGERTMIELAEIILKLTGAKSELKFEPLPVDDPKRRCPDITLAKEKLGWNPTISLEEGLKKTIDYFKTHQEFRKVL